MGGGGGGGGGGGNGEGYEQKVSYIERFPVMCMVWGMS